MARPSTRPSVAQSIADFIYVATNVALGFSGVLGVRLASS